MVFGSEQLEISWWQEQYQRAVIELRQREAALARSKALHQKALEREALLQQEIKELKAKLRQREQQLFGRKTERRCASEKVASTSDACKRPRGQQKGRAGHGRRSHDHLPVVEDVIDLDDDQKYCAQCHLPFDPFPGTEDFEELHIQVKAHRRVIRRKRYQKTCQCESTPAIITAPTPAKLIPKGKLGISIWVHLLLGKYLYYQPLHRLLEQCKLQGLFLPQGTVTDGLKRLLPLFKPIYQALITQQLSENHWHADETRWLVFEPKENKSTYRWYLWVIQSTSAVVFILDPSRSAKVVKDHFGEDSAGILNVDRYSAYKAMSKTNHIKLAFCWSHVRRDFLKAAQGWPEYVSWAMQWVEDIGELYHLNAQRLATPAEALKRTQAQQRLQNAIQQMAHKRDQQLAQTPLPAVKKSILNSLKNHWKGLTRFVEHPHIPMDNNTAERALRGPVVGRKNYYGSAVQWSGMLAAIMFSICQTLRLFNINPQVWLTQYFQACAENGGNVPQNIQTFLPWKLSEQKKQAWCTQPQINDSS
jgi:transposase